MLLFIKLPWFLLRYAFYQLRLMLFRIFLLLVFFARPAAPAVTLLGLLLALFLGWKSAEPTLRLLVSRWIDPWLGWLARQGPLFSDGLDLIAPFRLELTLGCGLLLLYVGLKLFGNLLWFLLSPLPFPERPLPPVWFRGPRRHRIRAVRCRIATPRLKRRYWRGDVAALEQYLKPELRALLEAPPVPASLPAPETRPKKAITPQENSGAREDGPAPAAPLHTPQKVRKPSPHRSRPAAPPLPPAIQAAEQS